MGEDIVRVHRVVTFQKQIIKEVRKLTLDKYIENSIINIKEQLDELEISYKKHTYVIHTGDRYSRLTVVKLVRYIDNNGVTRKGCICKCSCRKFIGPSRLHTLLNSELTSCGCYSKEIHSRQLSERNFKHGDCYRENRSKLYSLWVSMINRATNLNRKDAKYYAAKGIELHSEWRDYTKFREWAINNGYKDGLSIERIDVSKGYYPENCTFIQLSKQNLNKTTSRIITYNGESKNMVDWCKETKIQWSTLDRRLKSGMSVGKALGFE